MNRRQFIKRAATGAAAGAAALALPGQVERFLVSKLGAPGRTTMVCCHTTACGSQWKVSYITPGYQARFLVREGVVSAEVSRV